MKAEELCDFVYDVDYYSRRFITDEISDNGIDPPDDQIKVIQENVSGFLDDCVRIGWYLFLNFYGQFERIKETCVPRVCRCWSYQMYLNKKEIGLYLSPDFSFSHILIIKKENNDPQNFRCCEILQDLECLPSQEIREECCLMKEGGIRCWHNGCTNYRMAINYSIPEYSLQSIKDKIKYKEIKTQIIEKDVPFLKNWIVSLGLKDDE